MVFDVLPDIEVAYLHKQTIKREEVPASELLLSADPKKSSPLAVHLFGLVVWSKTSPG